MRNSSRVAGTFALAVCLALLTSSVSPVAATPQADGQTTDFADVLERAAVMFEKRDYAEAIRLYAEADERSGGTSYEALMGLARSNYQLGRLGDAARQAFDAIELGGSLESRAEACMLIGHTYLDPVAFEDQVPGTEMLVPEREKNLEMAAGFFRQAMQYASVDSPDAWLHLAQAFDLAGEAEAAAKLYQAYLEHDPEGAHAGEVKAALERLAGSGG